MTEPIEPALVPQSEAAWLDVERAARQEEYRARFWAVLDAIAEHHGAQLVLGQRSAARWDNDYDPPRLLAATVRFERPGLPKRSRKRRI